MKKVIKYIKNPSYLLVFFGKRSDIIPSKLYLSILFKKILGYSLNLKNPKTFNEKLQWLKLYGNLEKVTNLVDKYEVRNYIVGALGEEYLIPLLGVWNKAEDIDFDKLPNQFVLKCTHDCASVIICKDKGTFDTESAKNKLNKCLKQNFYPQSREPQYRNIKPRIICEKYMSENMTDYKFHCFNGKAKLVQIIFDRFIDKKNNLYIIPEWQLSSINIDTCFKIDKNWTMPLTEDVQKKMVEISNLLSKEYPYLRVDLYYIENKIYFGELTFTPAGGFLMSEPKKFDFEMGKWLKLPKEEK